MDSRYCFRGCKCEECETLRKQKRQENSARYRANADKEASREYQKKYYENNKADRQAAAREYNRLNKDNHRLSKKEWDEKNPDRKRLLEEKCRNKRLMKNALEKAEIYRERYIEICKSLGHECEEIQL